MKPSRRRLILIFSVFLLSLASCLGWALWYLQSPSGSTLVLDWLRNTLKEDFQTDFEYSEAELKLLSGLRFKDLRISRTGSDSQSSLEFRADSLVLAYELSPLSRRIDIHRLQLEQSLVRVRARPPSEPAPSQDSETRESVLAEFIQNPPVRIKIHDLTVRNLWLDVESIGPNSSNRVSIENLDLDLALEIAQNRVMTKGLLIAEERKNEIHAFSRTEATSWSLESGFRIRADWNAGLYYDGSFWRYEVESTNLRSSLLDFSLTNPLMREDSRLRIATADLTTNADVKAQSEKLLQLDTGSIENLKWNASLDTTETFIESQDKGRIERTSLASQRLDVQSTLGQDVHSSIQYQAVDVRSPEHLHGPALLSMSVNANLPLNLNEIRANGAVKLNEQKILDYEAHARKTDTASTLQSAVHIELRPELSRTIKKAKLLNDVGPVTSDIKVDFRIPATSAQGDAPTTINGDIEVRNPQYGSWVVKTEILAPVVSGGSRPESLQSTGSIQIAQLPGARPPRIPFQLRQPAHFKYAYTSSEKESSLSLEADFPSLEAKGVGSVEDSRIGVRGQLRGTSFVLEELSVRSKTPRIRLTGRGNGNTQKKSFTMEADVAIEDLASLSFVKDQNLSGQLGLPLSISVSDGESLQLSGAMEAREIEISTDTWAIRGLNGRIPFSERLDWDGSHFRFSQLVSQNPFERADFERLRPLLQGSEAVRIRKMEWLDRDYGPFIGFFSIRQNLVLAHQFDLDAGRGRINGQLFFNAQKDNLQFGVHSRLTSLDLDELLPSRFNRSPSSGQKKTVSGRTGVVLNLDRATLEGRLDINEIGGPQLISLLNVLDPNYEDEKMVKVRNLLQVGYPTSAALDFTGGHLNFDIGLSVLGVFQSQRITGVPISSLISKATSDLIKTVEKGPLK